MHPAIDHLPNPPPGAKPLSFQISARHDPRQETALLKSQAHALRVPLADLEGRGHLAHALARCEQPGGLAQPVVGRAVLACGPRRYPQRLAPVGCDEFLQGLKPEKVGQKVGAAGFRRHAQVRPAAPLHQDGSGREANLLADGVHRVVSAFDFHNAKCSTQFLCYDALMPKKQYETPSASEIVGLRARLGLTQTQFADYVRVSMRSVQQWEAGVHVMPPGLWELAQLKEALNARS